MTSAALGLLVTWTDPLAIGAAVAALALLGVTVALLTQDRGSTASASAGANASTASSQASGGGNPQPASTPQQLKQRAEQADNPLAEGSGESMAEMLESEEIDDTELLSRFVLDSEGETVGETMTVTADEVVIKQDGEFFAVDPASVIEKDGQLLLDPNVDWDAARQRGENWREANFDRMEYDEEGLPED